MPPIKAVLSPTTCAVATIGAAVVVEAVMVIKESPVDAVVVDVNCVVDVDATVITGQLLAIEQEHLKSTDVAQFRQVLSKPLFAPE